MNGYVLIPAPNMRRFWNNRPIYRMLLIWPDGVTTPVKGWIDARRFMPKATP